MARMNKGVEIMHTTQPTMLDCGHLSTPTGYVTGYAITPDARRICYTCADARELAALATADHYVAYLSNVSQGDDTHYRLTTWSGGTLARVTSLNRGHHNIGGFLYRFRAVDVHGGHWYGTSPGPGMYARMRRARSAK